MPGMQDLFCAVEKIVKRMKIFLFLHKLHLDFHSLIVRCFAIEILTINFII